MKRYFFIVALIATSSYGRILSYAPYTDRNAIPAEQHRMNRYFVLLETPTAASAPGTAIPMPPCCATCCYPTGQLVLYDTKGEFEPRVILPADGTTNAGFTAVAVRESGGVPSILVQMTNPLSAAPFNRLFWMLSTDGGSTWKEVALPDGTVNQTFGGPDVGGPFVRSRYAQIRTGTAAYPFVVSLGYNGGVFAISPGGSTKALVTASTTAFSISLNGSDAHGTKFLVRTGDVLNIVDLSGGITAIGPLTPQSAVEGWITPTGEVYVDERNYEGAMLSLYANGERSTVLLGPSRSDPLFGLIAVPTSDFSGAWIITRGASLPTTLYRHSPIVGLQKQWEDVTAPMVEALHSGASGNTLLIQVNRPRTQPDQRMFRDPALAIWHPGDPAPKAYDELFMNEMDSKAFVHLDVDAVEKGALFVFDSGTQGVSPVLTPMPVPSPPPAGGGSDVVQEWGVVRASLAQRLVLTSIGRTHGAFGSYWMSDVVIYNPVAAPQDVKLRFVESGSEPGLQSLHEKTITLAAREIRLLPDVLATVFNMESGNGALFVFPAAAVNVTARTYTRSDKGTYGFGMNGIDVFTAANARFPLTFSAAFQGRDFRTNLVLTDVSGRGSATKVTAVSITGTVSNGDGAVFSAPANGQQQYNGLSERLTSSLDAAGAMLLQPQRGDVIASVMVIDNRTNDPTWFPPDLPSSSVRTIPAIGHLDGANGAKFRTDLFMFNPYPSPRNVTLQIKAWDSPDTTTVNLTLLGNESRVISDALFRAFGKTGIARLRFVSTFDNIGVRMTARTYNLNDDGGTFGYLMPALNNFQSAAPGDALEILGVAGGEHFRTNIGLVELTAIPTGATAAVRVEVIDDKGATIDNFTANVAVAGGMQINDIFHARGLGDGPPVALIRVTPLSGMFAAYATTIDNGTNDPVYVAANLAAHE